MSVCTVQWDISSRSESDSGLSALLVVVSCDLQNVFGSDDLATDIGRLVGYVWLQLGGEGRERGQEAKREEGGISSDVGYKCDSSYLKSLQRWHHDIRYLLLHHNIPPYIRDTQHSMYIHCPLVTHMHTVEYTLYLSV